MIRIATEQDAQAITSIYNYYIENTVVTFETEVITIDTILARMKTVNVANLPWLVAVNNQGQVVGYAYASPFRERYAYRFSVEITVYIDKTSAKQGFGTALYMALISELKSLKMHVIIGVITLPNEQSVALHEKMGMTKVAHFYEIGYKFEQWLDVGYWQARLCDV